MLLFLYLKGFGLNKNLFQLFEKAVKTLERLKGDLLLEYIPPFNLV